LGDIKAVFDGEKTDRMASGDLADALVAMEGRPWAEWKPHKRANAKPLSKHQLANLLKSFHIVSDSVRIGTKTPKGYYRSQFESAWERYLPPEGVHDSQQRNNATAAGTSTPTQVATEDDVFRPVQSEKSNNDGHCCGVATCAGGEAPKAT